MIIFQSLKNQKMRRPSPPNMWDLFLDAWLWNFKATSPSSSSFLDLIHGLKWPKGDEILRWRKAMILYTILEEGKTHILCVFVSLTYLGSSIKNMKKFWEKEKLENFEKRWEKWEKEKLRKVKEEKFLRKMLRNLLKKKSIFERPLWALNSLPSPPNKA